MYTGDETRVGGDTLFPHPYTVRKDVTPLSSTVNTGLFKMICDKNLEYCSIK